jgi:hypothetical protein
VQSIPGLKLTTGYDFSQIYNVGRSGQNNVSGAIHTRGQLTTNGWFLHGQFDF